MSVKHVSEILCKFLKSCDEPKQEWSRKSKKYKTKYLESAEKLYAEASDSIKSKPRRQIRLLDDDLSKLDIRYRVKFKIHGGL